MSDNVTKIDSDRYTKIVANTVQKAFTDPDFLMTMRFSSLYKDEEFDNALAFSTWHFLFETGISQMKDYVAKLETVAKVEKDKILKQKDGQQQLDRINELILKFKMFDDSKPVDSKENIRIIRNYLRAYNSSLGYGIIMYDMHQALLNGRYAENGGQGRKDVKEVTKTILQRDYELQMGKNAEDDRGFIKKLLRLPP